MSEVDIAPSVKQLQFDNDDVVDAAMRVLAGANCRAINTNPDGACAIHAVFGAVSAQDRWLHCDCPRELLRELIGHPLGTIMSRTRPHMQSLVVSVTSALWDEFVVPHVRPGFSTSSAPNEEAMFLERLRMPMQRPLLDTVQARLLEYRTSLIQQDTILPTHERIV